MLFFSRWPFCTKTIPKNPGMSLGIRDYIYRILFLRMGLEPQKSYSIGKFVCGFHRGIRMYNQLMVNWWFGFLRSPDERDCYERGTPRIPNPPTKTTNLPLVDTSIRYTGIPPERRGKVPPDETKFCEVHGVLGKTSQKNRSEKIPWVWILKRVMLKIRKGTFWNSPRFTPPKTNMSLKKWTISVGNTSSGHWFRGHVTSGGMLKGDVPS